jgi:tetratricopeptide (TPR) repeat protein
MFWSSLLPKFIQEWQQRRYALREVNRLAEDEAERLRYNDTNPVNLAKIALSLNDHKEALRLWREAERRYPAFARTHRDALEIMLGLELFDEAEALMAKGKARTPRDQRYVEGYALVAERRGDLAEALGRWTAVRKQFPGWWRSHVHSGSCLRQIGQVEHAETVMRRAVELFPDSEHAWLEWVRCAEQREDSLEALRRSEAFYQRLHHAAGDLGAVRALEQLGRLDEAEERVNMARSRSPLVVELAIAWARISYSRGDREEALRRWASVKDRFPLLPFGYQGEIALLREMERFSEAEAVALRAMDRFPDQAWPAFEYATLADAQHHWDDSAIRWQTVRVGWPSVGESYVCGANALSQLGQEADATRLRTEWARRTSKS